MLPEQVKHFFGPEDDFKSCCFVVVVGFLIFVMMVALIIYKLTL